MTTLFGTVELGGTTCACAHGTGPGDLRDRLVVETRDPAGTLERIVAHLARADGELAAIGVASFGPLELDPGSPRLGTIGATPKPGWEGVNVLAAMRAAFDLPVTIDTDVNAAALAEWRWGAGQGRDPLVYVTVGTGIGGGGIVNGGLMHGLRHPEMGHMRVPRHPDDPLARGACPFHPDCWEGWAARHAIERRWGAGCQATDLSAPEDIELLAHYLAAGVVNIAAVLSPERIVMGGGIVLGGGSEAHRDRILASTRRQATALMSGYPLAGELDDYVVAAGLGADAGLLGGIALAERAAEGIVPRRGSFRPS